jgi:hypothetical protein
MMWMNVTSFMSRPLIIKLMEEFRYAQNLAPCTSTEQASLDCARLGASAIIPGLCGVFLTKTHNPNRSAIRMYVA